VSEVRALTILIGTIGRRLRALATARPPSEAEGAPEDGGPLVFAAPRDGLDTDVPHSRRRPASRRPRVPDSSSTTTGPVRPHQARPARRTQPLPANLHLSRWTALSDVGPDRSVAGRPATVRARSLPDRRSHPASPVPPPVTRSPSPSCTVWQNVLVRSIWTNTF